MARTAHRRDARAHQGAEAQYFGVPEGEGQDPAAALNALLHRVGQLAVRVRRMAGRVYYVIVTLKCQLQFC